MLKLLMVIVYSNIYLIYLTLSYRTTIICRSYRPTTDQITVNYRPIVSCRPTAFRIAD